MSTNNRKILNGYHVIFLTQSTMIGTGILSLPQRLSSLGYSQAFVPLLFGVIASISLLPMIWISSQYKNDNLFTINEKLLGKPFGKSVNLFIVVHFTLFLAGIISNYMHLIQTTALSEQSSTIPVFFLLLLLIYIVSGGIKSIARFCTITFFLTIPMLYFLRWAIEKGELSHLLPLFNFNGSQFLDALKKGYISVLGYELIMFYFPYIINQKKALKHSLIGLWISIILCFITTLVSVIYYSEWQLKNIEYSVLHLFKAGEFTFIERIDIIGITFWIFLILSSAATYLWSAKKGIDSLRAKKKNYHTYLITLAIFLFVVIPYSREYQDKLFKLSYQISYIMLAWPLLLAVVHSLKKKQVKQ
ncbi:GerAB/ArcD/ProY family transporter [Psychrobacillus vulpis]|uniref:Spore gernimation protein n=1 Tax=Psychrobacillus vulpis TaxID=2325572 RepID=A0A544TSB1_9BACI|nr:GerAB/ArcD/ProY family transporter [Psychrobacillus vulpis]TQR20333.1 spore gernimation protein [Psychrobacillus vulpis]